MNVDAFRSVFRHFVAILKDWKLIEGKIQTLDSFKIRAQNSLIIAATSLYMNIPLISADSGFEKLTQIQFLNDTNFKK